MNQLKVAAFAAALTIAYAGPAAALEDTGFYAGAGIGQSTVKNDDSGIDFDEDDTGFKVFGGYQFNKYFAVELAYLDGGKPSKSFADDGSFSGFAGADIKIQAEINQVNAAAIGTYAFNDYFGVLGRLGVSYVDAKLKVTASAFGVSASNSINDNATDVAYGVGLWAIPTNNVVLRLEYERTKANLSDISDRDTDIKLISVSAAYKFGR